MRNRKIIAMIGEGIVLVAEIYRLKFKHSARRQSEIVRKTDLIVY